MNFLLDHDVPVETARVLVQEGHKVKRVVEALSRHASDEEILNYSHQRRWVVITCNRNDFLRLAQKQDHAGIIILIRRKTRHLECASLLHLLRRAGSEGIFDNINFA